MPDYEKILEKIRSNLNEVFIVDLLKLAELGGWQWRRTKKGHYLLTKTGFPPVTIAPIHGSKKILKSYVVNVLRHMGEDD